MSRIGWLAFVAMKDPPAVDIAFQFTWPQAMSSGHFSRFSNVNDGEENTTGHDALLCRFEEISLEVVADGNEIPCRFLNRVLTFFKIRELGVDVDAAFTSSFSQDGKRRRRTVYRSYIPAALCEPERISACTARQIERFARSQPPGGFYE